MADGYLLSANDAAMLKEVIAEFRARKGNSTRRPNNEYWDEHQAPEVYVARTPSGGIPALVEQAGAGIVDTPGSARCQIYEVQNNRVYPIKDLVVDVVNMSTSVIAANKWIAVMRAKSGEWLMTGVNSAAGTAAFGEIEDLPGGSVDVTFDTYRPFGSGLANLSSQDGVLYGDFTRASKNAGNHLNWTHLLLVTPGIDIIDGMIRAGGANTLTYADGDEVRIGTAVYVVVGVTLDGTGIVYMMRHTP